ISMTGSAPDGDHFGVNVVASPRNRSTPLTKISTQHPRLRIPKRSLSGFSGLYRPWWLRSRIVAVDGDRLDCSPSAAPHRMVMPPSTRTSSVMLTQSPASEGGMYTETLGTDHHRPSTNCTSPPC